MSKKTSKKDRKNCRDINRDFYGLKKRQKYVEELRMKKCSICGEPIEDYEDDICEDCQASIIWNESIPPNMDDIV